MVASISTAAARPTPSCLNSSSDSVAKMLNTPTITAAALVTTPADDVTPAGHCRPRRHRRSRAPRGSG